MRLLLDTHVFLWYVRDDARLPLTWRQQIPLAESVLVSAASTWKVVIKSGVGKLQLPSSPADFMYRQRVHHGIEFLPIHEEVFETLAKLPHLHRDPFDRLIVAQALHHDLTLATVDAAIINYGVRMLGSD